jgi:uncharacterized repeat protein (TIGR03803 family)
MDPTQYRHLGLAAVLLALPLTAHGAAAAHFRVLHSFCQQSGCADGQEPYAGLVSDATGNLYGTTHAGGRRHLGTVFELSPRPDRRSWKYRVLHSFCSKAGCTDIVPIAPVIVDVAGNLYGTTYGTGGPGSGSIFKLSPNADRSHWSLRTLHRFCVKPDCVDGQLSDSGLTYMGAATGQLYDGESPLYGTTMSGGVGVLEGVAYELQPTADKRRWSYRVIHEFCQIEPCADGNLPYSGLVMDASGNLYGATNAGGTANNGTIFQLRPGERKGWHHSILYSFCQTSGCADGASPSDLRLDQSGALLGSAGGGANNSCDGGYPCGVIFSLAPSGHTWTETVLHSFCSLSDCRDGSTPSAAPIIASLGVQYGATLYGGGNNTDPKGLGGGVLFEQTDSFHVLHHFCALSQCADGAYPIGNLLTDAEGDVFGVTQQGGANGAGVIYEFIP